MATRKSRKISPPVEEVEEVNYPYSYILDKDVSPTQELFCSWVEENVGVEVDPETVKIAFTLRGYFNVSKMAVEARAARRAEKARLEEERLKKLSEVEVEDDEDEEEEEAKPVRRGRGRPKKTAAPVVEDDEEDEEEAKPKPKAKRRTTASKTRRKPAVVASSANDDDDEDYI